MLHIHEYHASRDCDGLYEYDTVISEFGGVTDREVWSAFMQSVLKFSSEYWTGRGWHLSRWTDEKGFANVEFGGPTDEGWRVTEARTCDDERCLVQPSTYRDHTAESMGF